MLHILMKAAFLVPVVVSDQGTTTPAPSSIHAFEKGILDALGYKDGEGCFQDGHKTEADLKELMELYKQGGWYNKAKAVVVLGRSTKEIVETLEECSSATTDVEQYMKLTKNLLDPRYYTLQNACTLALNVAEDRKMLVDVEHKIKTNDMYGAGNELMHTILDVLERPGIPSSNGTAALQIAAGLAEGFGESVDLPCFKDARVEIPSIIGGVLECLTGVGVIAGLESLFHGIEGLVPLVKDCYQEKSKIMDLFHSFKDFKNIHELARTFGHNVMVNGLDLSIEASMCVLDVKGKEWKRLGEDIGKILSKIMISKDNSTSFTQTYVVV